MLISARSQVLYDPSLGSLPDAQGWSYIALNFGNITKTMTENSVLLDTTSTAANQAGWSPLAAPLLDRTGGFALAFTARLNAETHNNNNRAGFSVIALGADTNGIELAFWTTNIFAQSDSPLFNHAEDTAFVTTNGFVDYVLAVLRTNYVLRANGTTILSGPVRNYTAFSGPINPYPNPNFIFFGDNTTSASGSVNVRKITLVRPPTLSSPQPGVISWTGVSNATYTVQASSNLTTWSTIGSATSANGLFNFTNSSLRPFQFLRVAYP